MLVARVMAGAEFEHIILISVKKYLNGMKRKFEEFRKFKGNLKSAIVMELAYKFQVNKIIFSHVIQYIYSLDVV